MGAFPAESNQVATFTLFNATSNALRIGKLESCCAFLEPVIYEKTIVPGASTPLDVLIDAHSLNGPFKKNISFEANGQSHTVWIEGEAKPAIAIPSTHIHCGHLPLGQLWTTNLAVAVRSNLPGKLTATTQSNIGLSANTDGKAMLQLSIPAQREPMRWQGLVQLRIEGQPQLPPVAIHLEGCMGGRLHPQPRKLALAENARKATFALHRKHPEPLPPAPTPLQCNLPDIGIKEELGATGNSTVELDFTDAFIQRLKAERRIPIQLSTEGYVPASLMIEYSPGGVR
ncbi:hypothetical protein PDESU_04636 [Pontiella desulfatans]|uniref:DUF1573 domain-containing protein n=2 Tax=Pontiella desulfatans TaxID=2750659 RepID=A0A6C2U9I8_PONDE|nr:hypothetical protein PDESU_04636 [Pontiella desulfatans]